MTTEFPFPANREAIRRTLIIMLTGWQLHEKSWDAATSKYTRDKVECMIEAAGGDEETGYMVYLYDHDGTDIQDMAPHFGVGYGPDGEVRTDIEPCPDETGNAKYGYKHRWIPKENKWVAYEVSPV